MFTTPQTRSGTHRPAGRIARIAILLVLAAGLVPLWTTDGAHAAVTVNWQPDPGQAQATSVGKSGDVWITRPADSLARWDGAAFQATDGRGVKIAVAPDGTPWVVDRARNIMIRQNNAWQQQPGQAVSGSETQTWGPTES